MSMDWNKDGDKLPMPTRRANIALRAMYIPVRFSFKQRKSLRILEAGLSVCQYADQDPTGVKPTIITRNQLRDISSILSGLLVASSYDEGQDLLKNRDFAQNKDFFMAIFEIGRRHKIMNPDKMRSEYGKMIYLLQDMVMYRETLEFNIKSGIKTVYSFLKERGAGGLLEDPDIAIATKEIYDGSKGKYETQREIKEKEKVLKKLCKKYESHHISSEEIQYCIYSITDNNSFLNANALPVEKMIGLLKKYYRPDQMAPEYDLSIASGTGGARLSHSHDTQYNYVLQSLMLWKEIIENMFMLWALAEDDLLNADNPYKLTNTGQGLQRVQECPQVSRVMHAILEATQQQMGGWVGSSTIHLGDHNVPNALMFIDKYTQVPRILVPIVTVIEAIDKFMEQKSSQKYIEAAFGSADGAKMAILTDFFRHGFDGSGADNFYDAGSCIDGRLTSAWNWCSQLEKKKYYPLFLLSGTRQCSETIKQIDGMLSLCPADPRCRQLWRPGHKQEYLHTCPTSTCKDNSETHLLEFIHECLDDQDCKDMDPNHRQVWHGPKKTFKEASPVAPAPKAPAPASTPKPAPSPITPKPETKPVPQQPQIKPEPKPSAQRSISPKRPFSSSPPRKHDSRSPPRFRRPRTPSTSEEEVPGGDGWTRIKRHPAPRYNDDY